MATIEFSSKGGDLLEGIKIGYLLREFDVATLVREGDLCLSACALAFLGGTQSRQPPAAIPSRRIAIGGKVGFHNFTINVGHVQAETRNDAAAADTVDLCVLLQRVHLLLPHLHHRARAARRRHRRCPAIRCPHPDFDALLAG